MKNESLLQACRLLFGEEVVVGEGFLDYLQPGGLKHAYRQRARQTHPDTLAAEANADFDDFHAVQQAYASLCSYLKDRDQQPEIEVRITTAYRHAQSSPPSATGLDTIAPIIVESRYGARSGATIDRLYQGPLPQRSLLFGHFLYYSGLTTWRTITAILVDQQRGRPRFGEMSTQLGLLFPEDVHRILSSKTQRRPFGEVAVSLGLLNPHQREMILQQQQRRQKKFGAILVEKELISLKELTTLLTHFRSHNRVYENQDSLRGNYS